MWALWWSKWATNVAKYAGYCTPSACTGVSCLALTVATLLWMWGVVRQFRSKAVLPHAVSVQK